MASWCRPLIVLDADGTQWEPHFRRAGFDLAVAGAIAAESFGGAVIDHYEIEGSELSMWRSCASVLAVVDDFGTAAAPFDVAVGPGIRPTDASSCPHQLYGLSYTLIDRSFAAIPEKTGPVQCLAIGFGGRDSLGATSLIADALLRYVEKQSELTLLLAIPPHSMHFAEVCSRFEGRKQVRLIVDSSMEYVLREADLWIGGGGVSLLERAAAGVPSITVCLAENQQALVSEMDGCGATISLGLIQDFEADQLLERVMALVGDKDRRQSMARVGKNIVDGLGCRRVSEFLQAMT